jgi:hypothetical protein
MINYLARRESDPHISVAPELHAFGESRIERSRLGISDYILLVHRDAGG